MDITTGKNRQPETQRNVVELELQRLMRSQYFASAPRMSAFLKYIVSEALEGRGARIKAYTVGVEALGKDHTFDAQSDPSVRVLALRLRKTLDRIYETSEFRHATIELQVGSYEPHFYQAEQQNETGKA